jgi:hypothetical protein
VKILLFSYDAEIVTALLPFVMTTAAPDGAPRGGLVIKNKKTPFPAVPRRGPEAGMHHMLVIFMIGYGPIRFMSVSSEPGKLHIIRKFWSAPYPDTLSLSPHSD